MNGSRPLPRLARMLPWPARLGLGLVAITLGFALVQSPFDSLNALAVYLGVTFLVVGAADLVRDEPETSDILAGAAWVVLGLVVVFSPGHAIDALPTIIGIYLLAVGAFKLWRVRSGSVDARLSSLLLGLTQIVLGVLALTWNDITLVIASALFGVLVILSGASLAWEAAIHRDQPVAETEAKPKGLVRRWGRVLASAVALVLALVLLSVSGSLKEASPKVDDFYTAPAVLPSSPGKLLRSEPYASEVPDGARAWRILYTTTDALDEPAVASAIVLVPKAAPASPHPVIAWAHGTTGYARQCAPSLLEKPFTAGAFPDVMSQVVANGWAVVATDYAGLGTEGHQPYIIGKGEAHSVLDAVRAARELEPADVSAEQTVVWGHSQGGGAALWTDQEQPSYAPDVPLLGTVAMAPAADPVALARNLKNVTGGSVFGSFVASAYADTYPDLELGDFVKPAAIPFVKKLASRCLSEPGVLASVLTALSLKDEEFLAGDPGTGVIGKHLAANIPRTPGPGPLFIAQGEADGLVIPTVTRAYVDQLRKDGHTVTFKTYPGLDHMPLVQKGSALLPVLIRWTAARFSEQQ